MGSYVVLDHTADLMIKASGISLEDCFETAAYALFDQTVDLSGVELKIDMLFTSSGIDDEDLLYSFLSDLLYYEDAEGFVFKEFRVTFEEGGLECIASGDHLDRSKHRVKTEIKAVTYHMMEIDRKTPSVTVLFDI